MVEPLNGAPKGNLEVPVGAACRDECMSSQVTCVGVLISVMSRSFTALLMVYNKDYSLTLVCETLST